jgi:hypothetical protein
VEPADQPRHPRRWTHVSFYRRATTHSMSTVDQGGVHAAAGAIPDITVG